MRISAVARWDYGRMWLAAALFAFAVFLANPPDGWSDATPWLREFREGVEWSGLVCFPASGWFFASAMLARARSRAAAAWPRTEATILASEVAPVYAGSGAVLAAPKVAYRYAVAGRSYRGETVQFGKGAFASDARAREIVDRYRPGQVVPVRFDPDDPATAALDLGDGLANRQLRVAALILLVPVALGLLGAWTNTR